MTVKLVLIVVFMLGMSKPDPSPRIPVKTQQSNQNLATIPEWSLSFLFAFYMASYTYDSKLFAECERVLYKKNQLWVNEQLENHVQENHI